VVADMGVTELDGTSDHWLDPQSFETSDNIRARVAEGKVDMVWHVGDLSYATGTLSIWELFDTRLTGIADRVPYMVGLGNHELDYSDNSSYADQYYESTDSGGECALSTSTRFPMPTPSGVSGYQGWYHFSLGPATFIMLNSELEIDSDSAQRKYFESTLTAVDRTTTPWLIVAFHRPLYYNNYEPKYDSHFAELEPLMYQNQVDLVLTGHVHNAMVSCAVYQESCVTPSNPGGYDAPVYVVTGNGGAPLTQLGSEGSWIEYQASEYGYSTISVNKTALHMELLRDSDDSIHYEFDIVRKYPRT